MPTGFNRILLGVVFFGLCIGAAFGAGAAWGRTTAPKAPAQSASTAGLTGAAGTNGTRTGAGATGTTGGRGGFGTTGGVGSAATDATPGTGSGTGTGAAGGGFARRAGVVAGVTGTVESVSGQTLTITPSGAAGSTGGAAPTPETVTLGSTASVGTVTKGDASTLKAGDTVLVTGQRGTDGSLTATTVMVLPQGFLQP